MLTLYALTSLQARGQFDDFKLLTRLCESPTVTEHVLLDWLPSKPQDPPVPSTVATSSGVYRCTLLCPDFARLLGSVRRSSCLCSERLSIEPAPQP